MAIKHGHNDDPQNGYELEVANRYIRDQTTRDIAFTDEEGLRQIDGYLAAAGGHLESFVDQRNQTRQEIVTHARAIELLGPLGWAVPKLIPASCFAEAIKVFDQVQDIASTEHELLRQISQGNILYAAIYGVGYIGSQVPENFHISKQRYRLVKKAYAHHQNEAYEASIPIVLSQIDGLFRDHGGRNLDFFMASAKKDIQNFLDPESALGWREMVVPLRQAFSLPAKRTVISGSLSRHGSIHGRELAYDTELKSAKCLVLLSAVIEWAQIRAKKMEAEYICSQQALYADTRAVDGHGHSTEEVSTKHRAHS